jgi:hypothetical protein
MRKKIFLILIVVGMLQRFAGAQDFEGAKYFKLPGRGQTKGEQVEGLLHFDGTNRTLAFRAKGGTDLLATSYASIRTLTYERAAIPRYWLGILFIRQFLYTREKQHFLTIQYGLEGSGQYALLRLDKRNFRHVLAMLESETGKKIDRVEEY